MRVEDHWLFADEGDPQIEHLETERYRKDMVITPSFLVIHYAVTGSFDVAKRVLSGPDNERGNAPSVQFIVARDGRIAQAVPLNRKSRHAGQSRYGQMRWLNARSVGFEIDNWGYLTPKGGKLHSNDGKGPEIAREKSRSGKNAFTQAELDWEIYPEPQLEAVFDICKTLVATYPIIDIVGHDRIRKESIDFGDKMSNGKTPHAKSDPGPLFPMARFRRALFPVHYKAEVQVEKLDLRSLPVDNWASKVLVTVARDDVVEVQKAPAPRNGWLPVRVSESVDPRLIGYAGWVPESAVKAIDDEGVAPSWG